MDEGDNSPPGKASKRVIVVAISAGVLGLVIFVLLVTFLSKGFGRFADKAAKRLVPQSESAENDETRSEPNTKKLEPKPAPRIPGL